MSVAEIDITDVEGWIIIFLGVGVALLKKYIKPFWRRLVVSQVLTGHTKLNEYRAKETLTKEDLEDYKEIVEDALKF